LLIMHLLHDVEHHVLDVRRGLAALMFQATTAVFPQAN
jgi:hypothetical protein